MAALLEAITVKRKMYFEFENAPYYCLDAEVSTPTARGGQTLVRLKMRNLLTQAVFDKTFKAQEKFKEPDLETVEASYLYSDTEGSYFLDQETFDTLRLTGGMIANALEYLVEGAIVKLNKFNGNPIGLELPDKVELEVTYTEAGAQGDTSGKVTKLARLETGLEIKAPLYIQEGESVYGDWGVCGESMSTCSAADARHLQCGRRSALAVRQTLGTCSAADARGRLALAYCLL